MKSFQLPKWEWVVLGVVLLVGTFLRFYHIPQTLVFLGDQGRDALIAKHILKDHHIALIGPVTSVGNMYLGPFYYYFMVPFLALTYPDPLGPALGIALVNSLSIILLFFVALKFFNSRVAIAAAAIYSLMPLAVQYSRFSWNPNLASPVAIIIFWMLLSWITTKRWKYAAILGVSLGVIIQLHYVALITWGVVGLNWLLCWIYEPKQRKLIFWQGILITLSALLMLSPLVAFDLRHNHLLLAKFQNFFVSKEEFIQPVSKSWLIVKETEGRMYQILSQMISGVKYPPIDRAVGWVSMIATGWFYLKKSKKNLANQVVIQWLLLSIVGLAFYSSSIFNHYLTFCIPIVAIYWALLLDSFWQIGVFGKIIGGVIAVVLITVCVAGLTQIPFNGVGDARLKQTVQHIVPLIQQPYNIALVAQNGDFQGMNYRYFFEVSGKPPQSTDEYHSLKNLVIIDEINNRNPLSVPAFEIQAPHLTTLDSSFTIPDGPRVYIYR